MLKRVTFKNPSVIINCDWHSKNTFLQWIEHLFRKAILFFNCQAGEDHHLSPRGFNLRNALGFSIGEDED